MYLVVQSSLRVFAQHGRSNLYQAESLNTLASSSMASHCPCPSNLSQAALGSCDHVLCMIALPYTSFGQNVCDAMWRGPFHVVI